MDKFTLDAGPERHVIAGWITKFLRPTPEDFVLEVGCSNGWYINAIGGVGVRHSVGLDMSFESLLDAKGARDKTAYVCGDAQRLPFKNESFSKVFCLEVLEHLPDDQGALREIYRILRSNGLVFIAVPNRKAVWGWGFNQFDKRMGHLRRYSLSELETLLGNEKIRVVQTGYFGHFSALVTHFSVSLPARFLMRVGLLKSQGRFALHRDKGPDNPTVHGMPVLLSWIICYAYKLLMFIIECDRWFLHRVDNGNGIYVLGVKERSPSVPIIVRHLPPFKLE